MCKAIHVLKNEYNNVCKINYVLSMWLIFESECQTSTIQCPVSKNSLLPCQFFSFCRGITLITNRWHTVYCINYRSDCHLTIETFLETNGLKLLLAAINDHGEQSIIWAVWLFRERCRERARTKCVNN